MATLIHVSPNTANYHGVPPDKYAALVAALHADPDSSGFMSAGNAGRVTYQKIDFAWQYDGAGMVAVTITADHNFKAKIAGNEAIFSLLNDRMFSKL